MKLRCETCGEEHELPLECHARDARRWDSPAIPADGNAEGWTWNRAKQTGVGT